VSHRLEVKRTESHLQGILFISVFQIHCVKHPPPLPQQTRAVNNSTMRKTMR